MKVVLLTVLVISGLLGALADGATKLSVVCTLRGKKYDVAASSVQDIREALEAKAGLEQDRQSVLFKGKKLDSDQTLEDAGVAEGDTINVVPLKAPKATSRPADTPSLGLDSDDEDEDEGEVAACGMGGAGAGGAGPAGGAGMLGADLDKMKEAMGGMDMDAMMESIGGKEGMDKMMKQFGLDGEMTPDKINQAMGQMQQMFQNPALKQFFEDPEMLEKSRKQILSNPMLMQAYEALGMGELIRNPEVFRNQMLAFKDMMENPETLAQLGAAAAAHAGKPVDKFDEGEL